MPTWNMDLIDRLSGPAAGMSRSLEMMEGRLRNNDRALHSLNQGLRQSQMLTAQGFKYDRLKLSFQRDELRMARQLITERRAGLGFFGNLASAISPVQALRSRFDELSNSMRRSAENGGLFRSAMSGASSAMAGLATGVVAVGAGVLGIGTAFAISTARAVDFGEAQRRMMMGRLGAVEGARQYEILIEYSGRYGTSLHDTFEQFQTFSRAGFNQNQAIAMMQQVGDAATVMGGQAASGLTRAIEQIMGKQFPQMEELSGQMAEHGLAVRDVFANIASHRGISSEQARGMFSSHQLSQMEVVAATMEALNRRYSQGGRAGTAMENRLNTLGGTIDLIKTRWEIFQTKVGETGAFAPVQSFLGRVAEMMDQNSESGRRFQSVLNDMFTGLFGEVGKQDPVKMFNEIAGGLRDAGKDARDLFSGLVEVSRGLKMVFEGWRDLKNFVTGDWNKINVGPGRSSPLSERSVEGSIAAARARGEVLDTPRRELSFWQALTGGRDNAALRTREAVASGAEIRPTVSAGSLQNMAAQRNVTLNGGITVHVDASGLQSGGATPAEVGRQIADAAHEQLSSQLNSAAASQGNPT
jgi:hypothetical protein